MNYLNLLNVNNLEHISVRLISSGVVLTIGLIIQLIGTALIKKTTKHALNADDESSSTFQQKIRTLVGIINSIWGFVVFGIVFLMILSSWGLDISPILTGAGILGLAIGFGSQTLVKDIVSGFFIIVENQFNVGDYIQTAGFEGNVVEMKLRTTTLKTSDGKIHIIPNSQVTIVTRHPKN